MKFKHVLYLLIGVGKKPTEEEIVTPLLIFVMAIALGIAFLGSVSLLMLLAKYIIG
tara:strand:- start:163 stop:330 length:168 start_codon:yes stop_codon:yes gene_type:complete